MMKKRMIKAAFVAALAFVAGYGVYASQQEVEMSDLEMAKVEALASGEGASFQNALLTFLPFRLQILRIIANIAIDRSESACCCLRFAPIYETGTNFSAKNLCHPHSAKGLGC